jgi:hypothetical protein
MKIGRRYFALVIGIALACWLFVPGRPRLLEKAQPVRMLQGLITNETWYSGYFAAKYFHSPSYAWLSDSELIAVRRSEQRRYEPVRVNVHTGEEKPCAVLTSAFLEKGNFCWRFSPDGRHVLFLGGQNTMVARYAIIDVNSGQTQFWTNRWKNAMPVWLNDSSAVLEWVEEDQEALLRLYRMGSAEVEQRRVQPRVIQAVQLARGNPLLAPLPYDFSSSATDLAALTWRSNELHASKMTLPIGLLPRGHEGYGLLSPQGDRLAWILFQRHKIPRVFFERQLPFVRTAPVFTCSVWISQFDGQELRPLGFLPNGEELRHLAWTPDGKCLSFVFKQTLWLLPAAP